MGKKPVLVGTLFLVFPPILYFSLTTVKPSKDFK
jgi:hypothetical protein